MYVNKKLYLLTCLPMGFVASVFVAQSIAATLLKRPELNYVDNIFGPARDLEEALQRTLRIIHKARNLSLSIKPSSIERGSQIDILGIRCNTVHKTVALAASFIEKHRTRLKALSRATMIANTTRYHLQSIGILLRAAYVLQTPFYSLPDILDMARTLSGAPLDIVLSIEVSQQMRNLASHALTNCPVYIGASETGPSDVTIVTDASLQGYGIIFVKENSFITFRGAWSDFKDNMPEREASALIVASLLASKHRLQIQNATWWTDSKTTILAAKKGHAKNAIINEAIRLIHELNLQPLFVRSADNPADTASRGQDTTQEDIFKLANLLCAQTTLDQNIWLRSADR